MKFYSVQKYILGGLCGFLVLGMVFGNHVRAQAIRPVARDFVLMGAAYASVFALESAVRAPFAAHRYISSNLLEAAVKKGDCWQAHALLLLGADPNKKTKIGYRLLFEAVERDDPDMVALLIYYGARVHIRGFWLLPLFFDAVERGNVLIVEQFIHAGVQVDMVNTLTGCTPLHWAARKGNQAVVELLVTHGANVNVRDYWKRTPADAARIAGHEDLAAWLERV